MPDIDERDEATGDLFATIRDTIAFLEKELTAARIAADRYRKMLDEGSDKRYAELEMRVKVLRKLRLQQDLLIEVARQTNALAVAHFDVCENEIDPFSQYALRACNLMLNTDLPQYGEN